MNSKVKTYSTNGHLQEHLQTAQLITFGDDALLLSQASQPTKKAQSARRWRLLRRALITLLSLLLAALLYLLLMAFSDGLRPGEMAPDFVGQTLQGQEIRLSALRNKETMLVFWSPDCSVCREELPSIQAIADDPAQPINLITVVSYTPSEEVKAFVAEKRLNFPIISDESGEISQRYNVHGIPFTFLIQRAGVIDSTIVGGDSERSLRDKIFSWTATCDVKTACTTETVSK